MFDGFDHFLAATYRLKTNRPGFSERFPFSWGTEFERRAPIDAHQKDSGKLPLYRATWSWVCRPATRESSQKHTREQPHNTSTLAGIFPSSYRKIGRASCRERV